ncbi:hypothetical protein I4U23_031454 [Adineta vaga]|nr:hypothetical protein I4U23_031454 [Adineta vaga]
MSTDQKAIIIISNENLSLIQDDSVHRLQSSSLPVKEPVFCDVPFDQIKPNREVLTLIWYNPTCNDIANNIQIMSQLRALNNYVLLYTKKALLFEYLSCANKFNEHCIVVMPDIEDAFIVHDFQCVRALCMIKSDQLSKTSIDKYRKFSTLTNEPEVMATQLQKIIIKIERQIIVQGESDGLSVIARHERALRDVRQDIGPFLWCHVFKIMIMAMPKTLDALQEMIDECRSYYEGNPNELNNIDKFERTYQSKDAINWYTRPTFLYRLVNRALRTEDITAMYIFRYFIADLCRSLETVPICSTMITKVYRGSIIARDEIEKYRVGNLVSTTGFLSCSCQLSVAQIFISWDALTNTTPSRSRTDSEQYVLFEFELDSTIGSETVLADISDYSAMPDENEVLFTLGTTFEIVTINYHEEQYLWLIHMRPSAEIRQMSQLYEKYIRERMAETKVSILYGILLADISDYTRSKIYFEHLLERMSSDHEDRANILYCLARAYRFFGQYGKALEFFQQAEILQRKQFSSSAFDLARTLAGIGSTYCEMHNHQQELIYYKLALKIYRNILSENHIELARSYNRLGYAYHNLCKYKKGITYCQKSVVIYNKTVPEYYPDKSQPLHNIGLMHNALGHREQALEYFEKALKLRETSLPADHPQISDSYYSLACFHQNDPQQHTLALDYARRALQIREKKLPESHEFVRQAKDLVDQLQNRSMEV